MNWGQTFFIDESVQLATKRPFPSSLGRVDTDLREGAGGWGERHVGDQVGRPYNTMF